MTVLYFCGRQQSLLATIMRCYPSMILQDKEGAQLLVRGQGQTKQSIKAPIDPSEPEV